MCAIHSNDTISYLMLALCVLATMVAFEKGLSPWRLGVLSIVLAVTLFTKYTAFAAVPMVIAPFAVAVYRGSIATRSRLVVSALATLALPLALLAGYLASNLNYYHTLLPWNIAMFDPSEHRPRDEGGISFFTFKPWEDIRTPMLAPGKLHSFWTLIYSGMWFDTEPCFLPFLDANKAWWRHYRAWYLGQDLYPGKNPSPSGLAVLSGRGLILLGLGPLALIFFGLYRYVCGKWSEVISRAPALECCLTMLPVLLASNAAGVIALTLRLPVYNSMKPSYLLNSMPAFMVFLALGLMSCEQSKILRRTLTVAFGALYSLVSLHIGHIVWALLSA
jgi:hypothetical protein